MRELKFRAWDKKKKLMIYHVDCPNVFANTFKAIVMQYTGLKDKNGKEIYEGDILKCKDTTLLVEWEQEDHWGWKMTYLTNWTPKISMEDDFEVIGNIYENPELLI